MDRKVTKPTLDLIKEFEGLHDGDKKTPNILEPQADPVGIYTMGWGYALFLNGKPVKDRATAFRIAEQRWPGGMTRAQADALLEQVAQEVQDRVLRLLGTSSPTDNQLGAMVSLSYNIGTGEPGKSGFATSSVRRLFLAGDLPRAADAFLMWKFSGGRELPGLLRRRERERDLFLSKK